MLIGDAAHRGLATLARGGGVRDRAACTWNCPPIGRVLASRLGMTPETCLSGRCAALSAGRPDPVRRTGRSSRSPTSPPLDARTPAASRSLDRAHIGAADLGQGASSLVSGSSAGHVNRCRVRRPGCSVTSASRPTAPDSPDRPNLLTFGCSATKGNCGRTPPPRRCRTCWSRSISASDSTRRSAARTLALTRGSPRTPPSTCSPR